MKITEFIAELEQIKAAHGDLEIMIFEPDRMEEGELEEVPAYIAIHMNENDIAKHITLLDQETALGLD